MDRFTYNYLTLNGENSNRLNYVEDSGTDYATYDDIKIEPAPKIGDKPQVIISITSSENWLKISKKICCFIGVMATIN